MARASAWSDPPPVTDGEQRRFAAFARRLLARNVVATAAVLLLATLASWAFWGLWRPRMSGDAGVVDAARGAVGLVCLAVLALARGTRLVARHPAWVGVPAAVLGAGAVGALFSRLGDPGAPWYPFLLFTSFVTVPTLVPLRRRVQAATAVSLAVFAGYFLATPSHLGHRLAGGASSVLVFATLCAVLLGHALYGRTRTGFVRQLRLRAEREHLRRESATLEERVAEQTATLRAATRRLTAALDEERVSVAREVHDRLGQELTALRYTLALARSRARGGPPAVAAALDELTARLDGTRSTMRRLVARLRSGVLEQLGLEAATRWAVEDLTAGCRLRAELRIDPPTLGVPHPQADALFFALREGLANVARHSYATAVEVSLERRGGRVRLRVADNGVGLPAADADAPSPHGVGRIAVRERVAELGGWSRWSAPPDGGVVMEVELPVDGEDARRRA